MKLSSGDGKEPNFDFTHPECMSHGGDYMSSARVAESYYSVAVSRLFTVHHQKMAKWLCLASAVQDFCQAGKDAEGVLEVHLRAT